MAHPAQPAPQATRKGWPYYTRFARSLRGKRRGVGGGVGLGDGGMGGMVGLNGGMVGLGDGVWNKLSLYALAAFVFGTIACVNPWDMPAYGFIFGVALLLRVLVERRAERGVTKLVSLGFALVTWLALCGLGYLLYWPFYAWYQQLYVNGLGVVRQGTTLGDFLTVFGFWLFLALSFFLFELYPLWKNVVKRLFATKKGHSDVIVSEAKNLRLSIPQRWLSRFFALAHNDMSRSVFLINSEIWGKLAYLLVCSLVLIVSALIGLKALLAVTILCCAVLAARSIKKVGAVRTDDYKKEYSVLAHLPVEWFTYLLLLMGLCICLGQEIVYVRDFLDGGDYERMNTVFKFSMQAWLCFAVGGALALRRLWSFPGGIFKRAWMAVLIVLVVGCSVFLSEGTLARVSDHQVWIAVQKPVQSAKYTPTLDGFAFARAWYPSDADAISWLNENIAGSPVILEAAAPFSYQWYSRVSVYTGLPDVLGWADHEGEQRYNDDLLERETDIDIIYTTSSTAQALELLRYYNVGYIYIGPLESQLYGLHSMVGLDKFQLMVGDTLKIVYQYNGVIIYEVL